MVKLHYLQLWVNISASESKYKRLAKQLRIESCSLPDGHGAPKLSPQMAFAPKRRSSEMNEAAKTFRLQMHVSLELRRRKEGGLHCTERETAGFSRNEGFVFSCHLRYSKK